MALDADAVCASTGDVIPQGTNHLVATVKVVKRVQMNPPVTTDGDYEDDAAADYVGTRSGEGFQETFSSWEALADWARDKASEDNSMKLKYARTDDSGNYAEAMAESGSADGEGEV